MASYERLHKRLGPHMSEEMFDALIDGQPGVFRRATIKGGKPGIAKRVP